MISNEDFTRVTDWLRRVQRPLLVSHRRPDGDALGSLAAMSLALRALGAHPVVALFEPFPPRYELLRAAADWQEWERLKSGAGPVCDSVVVLDTCSRSQLEPIADFLPTAPPTLVIDHHATRDDIGERSGDLRLIDATAGANALILAEWIDAARLTLTAKQATALFVGLATDCGWFRFSNTDGRMLRAAARLVEAGARTDQVYAALYQQDSAAKVRLVARVLSSLDVRVGGRLAVLQLRQADYAAAGADRTMTEDLVNEASRLAGVECTLLFSEESGGEIRVNLRSREVLDVAALAARFGGGGHKRAAGCRLRGDWSASVAGFVRLVEEELGR